MQLGGVPLAQLEQSPMNTPAAAEATKPVNRLTAKEEAAFQRWYSGWAGKAGLDPNPDSPLHKYDYRAAFKDGAVPQINPSDGLYHWPSEFKAQDHPNRFVGGIDTITGKPAAVDKAAIAKELGGVPIADPNQAILDAQAAGNYQDWFATNIQTSGGGRAIDVFLNHLYKNKISIQTDEDADREFNKWRSQQTSISPTLLASRQAASKSEFEANQPPSTVMSRMGAAGDRAKQGIAGAVDFLYTMAGGRGPLGQLEMIKGIPAGMVHAVTGAPSDIIGGAMEGDRERMASGAMGLLTETIPAVEGVRSGVNAVRTPAANRLATGAAKSRAKADAAAEKPLRIPLSRFAAISESVSQLIAPGRKIKAATQDAVARLLDRELMDAVKRYESTPQLETKPAPGPQRPIDPNEGIQSLLTERQLQNTPQLETRAPSQPPTPIPANESMQALLRERAIERTPSMETKPPAGPAAEIPFNPPAELLERVPPKPPWTPEAVNKWMKVSPKEVMRGTNPGKQVISEKLLGENKLATQANVETALKDAGKAIEAQLKDAAKRGVKIDGEAIVDKALSDANKPIGAPKDATFQSQLSGVLDDIIDRYPNLRTLSPAEAHALKVELGDSAKWSGVAYDNAVNQVLVRMYRDLNSAIKTSVPEVAETQSRWGNLYVASKSLKESIAYDVVGKGTGPKLIPPKKK